jgi:predicted metal-binding membrane protein
VRPGNPRGRREDAVTLALESILKRDRAIVLAGLFALVVVAWLYLVHAARAMSEMAMHAAMGMMPQTRPWSGMELLLLFVMWVVMMIAMMTPSATPMLLMFTAMNRRRAEHGPVVRTGIFLLGYLMVWGTYSALAALAQWILHGVAWLSPMMVSTSPYLGGGLLIAAGIFQWTPLKRTCLTACRSPLGFIMSEWRAGARGALVMGIRHGVYCVGCCWVLMALLFVAGVMNLIWVAAIAIFVLVEKALPGAERLSPVAGAALIVAGALVMTYAPRG